MNTSKTTEEKEIIGQTKLPGYKTHHDGLNKNIRSGYYQETNVTVNNEGEVLSTDFKSICKETEGDFIKLYLEDICALHQMQGSQHDILYSLIKTMNYKNLILVNKGLKEIIAREVGKSLNTVNNVISSYVKKGILIRQDRGVYVANPYLFGKGKFTDIKKLRTSLEYTAQGIKIKTDVFKND